MSKNHIKWSTMLIASFDANIPHLSLSVSKKEGFIYGRYFDKCFDCAKYMTCSYIFEIKPFNLYRKQYEYLIIKLTVNSLTCVDQSP